MAAFTTPALRMWSRNDCSLSTIDNRRRKASIREAWTVLGDDGDETVVDLLDASPAITNLPKINDLYPNTTSMFVKSVSPRQMSPIYWIVEVVYEGETADDFVAHPTTKPMVFNWGKVDSTEEIDQDANGNPIVTFNNEAIKGVTKTISDLVLNIEQNYLGIDLSATYQYLHSTNSDTFAGFAPGQAHMTGFSADHVVAENTAALPSYWKVKTSIQFRYPYNTTAAKAWYARVRHEGFQELNSSGKLERAKGDDGVELSSPVLLKADGKRETVAANTVWLEFPLYDSLPYNALGFRWP